MAITNYSELLTAGANFTGRDNLTSRWPEFIALTEALLNRELRTVDQETKNASFSLAAEYNALPADFLDIKTIYVNGPPRTLLTYKADGLMTATYPSSTGTPVEYCVQGSNLRVSPTPTGATPATLVYAAKVPALTGSATTNWVITNWPDIYVAGICYYAWIYAMHKEKADFWKAVLFENIASLKAASDKRADRSPDEDFRDEPKQRP